MPYLEVIVMELNHIGEVKYERILFIEYKYYESIEIEKREIAIRGNSY